MGWKLSVFSLDEVFANDTGEFQTLPAQLGRKTSATQSFRFSTEFLPRTVGESLLKAISEAAFLWGQGYGRSRD